MFGLYIIFFDYLHYNRAILVACPTDTILMCNFISFLISGVVFSVVVLHNIPTIMYRFRNFEPQFLIQRNGSFVFYKYIQYNRCTNRCTALLYYFRTNSVILKLRKHKQIIYFKLSVFILIKMIISCFFTIGMNSCIFINRIFYLFTNPVHYLWIINCFQLFIIVNQLLAQFIDWLNIFFFCFFVCYIHKPPFIAFQTSANIYRFHFRPSSNQF